MKFIYINILLNASYIGYLLLCNKLLQNFITESKTHTHIYYLRFSFCFLGIRIVLIWVLCLILTQKAALEEWTQGLYAHLKHQMEEIVLPISLRSVGNIQFLRVPCQVDLPKVAACFIKATKKESSSKMKS